MYWNRLTHRIGKLITFIKLGWNDYDWDSQYLFDIMLVKLKQMENHFKLHGVAENHLTTAKQIRVARKCLDYYVNKENTHYEIAQKYHKINYDFDFSGTSIDRVCGRTNLLLSPRENKLIDKMNRKYEIQENKKRRKAKLRAFRIMFKYERHWWD